MRRRFAALVAFALVASAVTFLGCSTQGRCTSNADCTGATPACLAATGECVAQPPQILPVDPGPPPPSSAPTVGTIIPVGIDSSGSRPPPPGPADIDHAPR